MKIDRVAVVKVTGVYDGPEFPAGDRQAQPLDIYPEFNARPASADWQLGRPLAELYLEIGTDDGCSGLWGAIDEMQAAIILRSLRPLLTARDPLATELLFDLMIRSNRHGRSGLHMMAASAVDCALWDLKGKAWGQPVYRLLGGPTRPAVPAYASMLGFSVEPDAAAATAREFKAKGYAAQKWFFRYGPSDGEEGKARNLAMAAAVREATGPAYTLMFDAFMGWTTHYMEEAEILADRVAIIRRGEIVAEGTPNQLRGADNLTTVRFRLPQGEVGIVDGIEGVHRLDGDVVIASARPTALLHELTGRARARGVELEDLTVGRTSLEDTYLRLVAEDGHMPAQPEPLQRPERRRGRR